MQRLWLPKLKYDTVFALRPHSNTAQSRSPRSNGSRNELDLIPSCWSHRCWYERQRDDTTDHEPRRPRTIPPLPPDQRGVSVPARDYADPA